MRIEIELDDDDVRAAAIEAARQAVRAEVEEQFRSSYRFEELGPGARRCVEAVRERVAQIDLAPVIDEVIGQRLVAVVRERIDSIIAKAVDKELKLRAGAKPGGLFGEAS